MTYKPGSPLSFMDEETLILSSFLCRVEISCPPKDIKMRSINVHCHFDRPYSPVSLDICSRRENYQILSPITGNKRGSLAWVLEDGQPVKAWWKRNCPIVMDAICQQGEPDDSWPLPASEVLAEGLTVTLRPANEDPAWLLRPVRYCELFSYVCFRDLTPILKRLFL